MRGYLFLFILLLDTLVEMLINNKFAMDLRDTHQHLIVCDVVTNNLTKVIFSILRIVFLGLDYQMFASRMDAVGHPILFLYPVR